jgi:hypothetical protein
VNGWLSQEPFRTHDRQNLELAFFPRWELVKRQLETFRLDTEAGRHGVRRRHPDVRVRGVLDLRADRQALQLLRQDVEHCLSAHERGRAQRNRELIARPVVVLTRLRFALRHSDCVERRRLRRAKVVQGCVDVPAVEACDTACFVHLRHSCLVKCCMRGMLQHRFGQSFMIVNCAVPDELNLRDARNGLEVGVENGLLRLACLVIAVPVVLRGGIEQLPRVFSTHLVLGTSSVPS